MEIQVQHVQIQSIKSEYKTHGDSSLLCFNQLNFRSAESSVNLVIIHPPLMFIFTLFRVINVIYGCLLKSIQSIFT